jgi:hypothetical protein
MEKKFVNISLLVLMAHIFFCWLFIGKVHHGTGHEGPERKQNYCPTLSLTSTVGGVRG